MLQSRIALFSIAFVFGLLLTACSSKPEDKIIGTWTVDIDATMAEDPKMKEMPEEQKEQAKKAAEAFLSNMSFEFTKDGQAIAKMGDKEQKGAFTIKKTEGDTLTLDMTSGEGENVRTQEMTVTVKGDQLHMAQGEQKFVLKKK